MNKTEKIFLTKDDKIDLISRMDLHFKWLVIIMLTSIGLSVILGKLL